MMRTPGTQERATAFARTTVEYHSMLAFGVRSCVSKSTCTRPQRWLIPSATRTLSSSDHA